MDCPGCDTDYTSKRELLTPQQLLQNIEFAKGDAPCKLVVLTGGEPFRQECGEFACLLMHNGYELQVETNGTCCPEEFPWASPNLTIVCSPKTPGLHGDFVYRSKGSCTFKYVLREGETDPVDGLPTSVLGNKVRVARPPGWVSKQNVYIQPFDEGDPARNEANLQHVKDISLKYGYRASCQLPTYVKLN